jgi:hypothetical protein
VPLLERMAAGDRLAYSDVEAAYAAAHGGRLPKTQTFPVSAV